MLVCMWRTFMPLWQPKGTFKRTQYDQGNYVLLGTLQQAHGKVMFHINILSISSLYGIMVHEICPCTMPIRPHLLRISSLLFLEIGEWTHIIPVSGRHHSKITPSFKQKEKSESYVKKIKTDLTHQYEVAMNLFLVFSYWRINII